MTVGIVTGIKQEAYIAGKIGFALAGGGTPLGAEAAAELLVAQGATALLSFGLAGGLDPKLPAGTIVVPYYVLENGMSYATDPDLSAWVGGPTTPSICAGNHIVALASEKQALFQALDAAAIDLESGAVARVAARHAIPFAVLRAICDPAARNLPPAALIALDTTGAIKILPILASLLRHPGQIPDLLALARETARARTALDSRIQQIRLGPNLVLQPSTQS